MEHETPKESAPSHGEAMARIAMAEQRAQVMGANDYEPAAFQRIRQQLTDGDLTPTEAVAAAEAVLDNKQDYH